MLSTKDFAGSGNHFCKAIQRNSDINIRLVIVEENDYHYDYDYSLQYCAKRFIQQIVNKADLIHFKGDELPEKRWNGINIPNVPILITVGGSGFRRHAEMKEINLAWHPVSEYVKRTLWRSALTPDLNYDDFKAVYLPQVIDIKEYLWQEKEIPVIMHSPSHRKKKGTDDYIIPALEILKQRGVKFEFKIIEGVSNKECIELKKSASLFIDQVSGTGFYGISSLEAMQYGIPVVNYISKEAFQQSNGLLEDCPIINVDMNINDIADKIEHALSDLKSLSIKTYDYCKRVHSYESNKLHEIYKKIYSENLEMITQAKESLKEIEAPKEVNGNVRCRIANRKAGIVNDIAYFPKLIAESMKDRHLVEIL